jgi:hypothetical protein
VGSGSPYVFGGCAQTGEDAADLESGSPQVPCKQQDATHSPLQRDNRVDHPELHSAYRPIENVAIRRPNDIVQKRTRTHKASEEFMGSYFWLSGTLTATQLHFCP